LRILISSIGLGQFDKESNSYKYSESNYKFDDDIISTAYFPFAVFQKYKPDLVYLMMTEKARLVHSVNLTELFKYNEVIIPDGKNEKEIWEIFDNITQCVSENDEVILDFTFGFRSQPVIAIASLLYLKALRNIKILNLLYGAYEARENDIVPVFDLKPFLELTDWSYAVNEFLNSGRAGTLNKLMNKIHTETYTSLKESKSLELKSKGRCLYEITKALSVLNLNQAFLFANEFTKDFDDLIKDLNNINQTKPLSILLKKILDRIEPISQAEKNMFSSKGINAQFEIIKWYIDTEQYQQAITLMNELFITIHCIINNLIPIKKDSREEISKYLGELIIKARDETSQNDNNNISDLWNSLSQLRNDINHAGMKEKNAVGTDKQIENIKNLYIKLKSTFSEMKLFEESII
jgi:hypothetical protein